MVIKTVSELCYRALAVEICFESFAIRLFAQAKEAFHITHIAGLD